jgi:HD-GYP domain-containing protein (c-di-GMP phosphodiesterase class II)
MDRSFVAPLAAATTPGAGDPPRLRLSELISALSHALDMTEGQPKGHCLRCCWMGVQLGEALRLPPRALWELYYTLLLKDLGCSSNAARICELYLTDDLEFKRGFKLVGDSLPEVLSFVFQYTAMTAGFSQRLRRVVDILRHGREYSQELIQTRCQRGADIARRLRFPEAVAQGIHGLDEHWNGRGRPEGRRGEAIPLNARIALLTQVVDVFRTASGPQAALDELRRRSGQWFDPALVRAFEAVASQPGFWAGLDAPDLDQRVLALEPGGFEVTLDDDYLDDIAEAFGQVVDTKSPFTSGHSERVAQYADGIAGVLGLAPQRRRWLRRAALLHDVGKLGVSNAILDKPGALDAPEWEIVRRHAELTEQILGRIHAFGELAQVAGAHHERLDGRGYPRALAGDAIPLETRIITTADIFDAISAERPYRGAVPVPRTLEMMAATVGTALDAACFEALKIVAAGAAGPEGPGRP